VLGRVDWDFVDENPSSTKGRLDRIHWYPATFVSPLARTLIDALAPEPGALVYDPFCGSGTTPLEAWFGGRSAAGSDIHGFAVDLCRARVATIARGDAATAGLLVDSLSDYMQTAETYDKGVSSQELATSAGMSPEVHRWFVPQTVRDLACAKRWVVEEVSPGWTSVMTVLLSSILRRVSLVREYHYTYIVDRSRVAKPALEALDVAEILARRIRDTLVAGEQMRHALERSSTWNCDAPPTFERASCADLAQPLTSVDAVVTSPPYFGMNDYVRSQYLTSLVFPSDRFAVDLSEESGSRRARRSSDALASYLDSMQLTFARCERMLGPNGKLALVVGASQSALVRELDVLSIMKNGIESLGFRSVWEGNRRVRFRKINHRPSTSELVWVFARC
jgi:hypothetical protein